MKNILIFYNDIQQYPPILSHIEFLLSKNEEVVILGYCSNDLLIGELAQRGVEYVEVIKDNIYASSISKLVKLFLYKKHIKKYLRNVDVKATVLWVYSDRNAWILHALFKKFKVILYLFEVPALKVSTRFRIVSPNVDYIKMVQSAWKVVCCEYNRAMIVQAYFNLTRTPIVIPNKPDIDLTAIKRIENCDFVDGELRKILLTKKVIVYQGVFIYPERRLDELCDMIDLLPSDFHLILMGAGSTYKNELISKYLSHPRIHILPRINFPDHLAITKLAYIGFLSYLPIKGNLVHNLNTLYCAPNKIFEYALFAKPMLALNNPSLKLTFDVYKVGCVVNSLNVSDLYKAVVDIDENYKEYSNNSFKFFGSVDTDNLLKILLYE